LPATSLACGLEDNSTPWSVVYVDAGADGPRAQPDGGTPSDSSTTPDVTFGDDGPSRDVTTPQDSGAPGDATSLPDTIDPPDTSQPDSSEPDTSVEDSGPAVACANPPCLNVVNFCPFPIWIHAANSGTALAPDNAQIAQGTTQQFDMPSSFSAARINAYWQDPTNPQSDPNAFDKVELTFDNGVMNYNITYVDYVALPSRIEGVGPNCTKSGSFDPRVECNVPVSQILNGCPDGLLSGQRCLSAGLYCSDGNNQGQPYCHALDSAIQTCASQNPSTCGMATQLGNTTPNAYSCSGYFDGQGNHTDGNKWCAALNRNMLAQPDSTDSAQYYQATPYNTYAKWVHETCPGIYAFAYDDYPSTAGQSGFRSCTASRLDVTFCPGG
jgi:hypothetical protein